MMLKLKRNFVINVKNYNISSDDNTDEEFDHNLNNNNNNNNNNETNVESTQQSIQLNTNNNNCIENNECLDCEDSVGNKVVSNDILLTEKLSNNETKTLKSGEKFCDFKIIVKSYGQRSERFIENFNGFETKQNEFTFIPKSSFNNNNNNEENKVLKEIIDCKNLKEIENILVKKTRKKKSKKRKFNKEIKPKEKESINSSMDLKPNDINYNFSDVNKTAKEEKLFKYDLNETEMIELKGEGIQVINNKNGQRFKCLICDKTYINVENALYHIQSDLHLKIKFGDYLRGIDALFTIDSESIGDVEFAIARQIELKKLTNSVKEEYFDHGIRLKDGMGSNAYICLKCNISFELLSEVKKHFSDQSLNKSRIELIDKTSENGKLNSSNSCEESLENIFKNEGIFKFENNYSLDRKKQFFCQFCNIYFDCEETVVSHLNDSRHKITKFGENLRPIDAQLTIKSDRINEFEVAIARKDLLKSMTKQFKSDLFIEGIRLKDGIGFDAFVCNKCQLSIPSFEEIETHIRSHIHSAIIQPLIDI